MTARKDFLQSLTLGKKSEPTAEYAPSLRSPWRASIDGSVSVKTFSVTSYFFHHPLIQLVKNATI
ncbi:hypothetical protein [Candidiatus Paracoxiella cheracis]|uniref:hypothetical protein n=1 Tax=Candidiatus Paracoxiella cheracis TaxID=3405120 RepID=UPI003BF4B601